MGCLAALVDAVSRPRVIWVSDFVRFVATGALALTGNYAAICLAFLLNGLMASLARPALSTVWSQLTESADERRKVFATNAMLNRCGLAAGGFVGGICVATQSYALGFGIDAVTFLISALFWVYVDRKHAELHGEKDKTQPIGRLIASMLRVDISFKKSWSVIAVLPWLSVYVITEIIAAIPLQIISVSAPIAMVNTMSPKVLGLWAALPSWLLLAGNVIARLSPKIPVPGILMATGGAIMALAYLLAMYSHLVWIAIAAMAIGRLIDAWSSPAFNAWVGTYFSPKDQGKAFAFSADAGLLLGPIGILIAAPLVAVFPASTVTVVAALIAAVLALVPLLFKGFANLRPEKP